MSFDFKLPRITADTEAGQISQMQSYMYQLVENLNWALNSLDTTGKTNIVMEDGGSGRIVNDKNAVETFEAIKDLIIKSADIVNSYGDVISRKLVSVYVAQSDFGDYVNETTSQIEANASSITQTITDIQTISGSVSGISDRLAQTDAYTRVGELYTNPDGIPVIGFEVGQTDTVDGEDVFNKYARFTAEGIYFYLPGSADAIAYMTGSILHITNADITGMLYLGRYRLDLSNGIAFRWIGG